jgi:DNA-binding LytR/AlgR family response regulator
VADFYVNPGHRWLVYTLTFIISGLGAFLAGFAYDYYDPLVTVPLTFIGMYAWHTATNFALWLCILDMLMAFIISQWGAYDRRTVGKTWILFLITYLVGFISQRILVYRLIALYFPVLLWVYGINPSQRTNAVAAFLVILPSVLMVFYFLMRIMLGMQRRSEELLRVRVDAILEERGRQKADPISSAEEGPGSEDEFIDLPLEQNRQPIRFSQIEHVTIEDHYLRLYYIANDVLENVLLRMPLRELVERLPRDQFIQIHRSHVVNLQSISGIKRSGRKVRLALQISDIKLPVSRHRLPHLLPVLEQYLTT